LVASSRNMNLRLAKVGPPGRNCESFNPTRRTGPLFHSPYPYLANATTLSTLPFSLVSNLGILQRARIDKSPNLLSLQRNIKRRGTAHNQLPSQAISDSTLLWFLAISTTFDLCDRGNRIEEYKIGQVGAALEVSDGRLWRLISARWRTAGALCCCHARARVPEVRGAREATGTSRRQR